MKTLLTTILTLLFYTGLFAQTIDKLDEKNGFKDFTLGDNLTKWENQLSYEGKWDDGSLAYLYKGTCCNKVFIGNLKKSENSISEATADDFKEDDLDDLPF